MVLLLRESILNKSGLFCVPEDLLRKYLRYLWSNLKEVAHPITLLRE